MVDLLPTLLGLAGHPHVPGLDGVDQWEAVSRLGESPRSWMVYNIDDELVTEMFNVRNKKTSFQVRPG